MLHLLWDEVIASERWSEGPMTERFESEWTTHNELGAVAFGGWAGGALAALEFAGVAAEPVLCPSNTFMATPLAIQRAGGRVTFVDCNREDLCMSFDDFVAKAEAVSPRAAFLVHVGGHIAFDSERIADYCRERGIFLIEDCAHAHGASWNGTRPGCYGDAGVYSFYATKTVSTGEGGMLVSRHPELLEFARAFRNYGKPDHAVAGLNFRMNEFTAAIGIVQTRAPRRDRRGEEPGRPRVARSRAPQPRAPAGGDDLRALQVHRLRPDRALDRQGLRPAVPSDHGHRRFAPEHRLGCR